MTIYNVHIYRELRLIFEGIEAKTYKEAGEKRAYLPTEQAAVIDDCDGPSVPVRAYIPGKNKYKHSRWLHLDEPQRQPNDAWQLLLALSYVRTILKLRHIGNASDSEVELALQIADKAITTAKAA